MFRKFIKSAAFLLCAFAGGAFAQTVSGGGFQPYIALAQTIFNGTINYSGTQSTANAALWSNVTSMTGTGTDSYSSPLNAMIITGDTATQSSGTGSFDGLYIQHDFGGAATGGRTGLNIRLRQTTASNEPTAAWVGLPIQVWGEANAGGSSGSPQGKVFALNPQCILTTSATFYARCTGGEVNTTVAAGASVANKLGWSVIQSANDKVQGSNMDGGYVLASQNGAVGWQCGWCTGDADGVWPITATGTIIGTWATGQAVPGTGSVGTTLYGLDWSQVTFASGGAPLVMPLLTPATSSAACKQGALEWDANYVYVCTATNTWKRAALASF